MIKYFSKTRKDWDICGGFIITILVNEALANITLNVDIDKLLLDVIKSISNRINFNTSVKNPTNNQELINDDKNKKRLKNLKEKLDGHISDIENAYLNNEEEDVKENGISFLKRIILQPTLNKEVDVKTMKCLSKIYIVLIN